MPPDATRLKLVSVVNYFVRRVWNGSRFVIQLIPLSINLDAIEPHADEQSPAGGSDAEQVDTGSCDDEGQQGGLTGIIVLQCGVQAAADGA